MLFGPLVEQGEWYRLLTSGFVHFGIIHLAFNMLLLFQLGQLLEPEIGRIRFALLYFAALLAGSAGVLLLDPNAPTGGASGAVFGLMGAAFIGLRNRGVNPMTTGLGTTLLLNLLLTFSIANISIGGHIGGLLGGAVAGWVVLAPPYRRLPTWTSYAGRSRSWSWPSPSRWSPSTPERAMVGVMNGAEAMIRTLVDGGVTTCFTNPGTSEMHFVAALDNVAEMRGVLGLFEGVATGAADGYARMAGRPACTLLHLGPGLGNGLANLHNARRAATPVVNIVGDHATYHVGLDAPLNSDIDTAARNVSGWIGRPERTADLCRVTAEAVAAAVGPPGQVATLILPADVSWSDGAEPAAPVAGRSGSDRRRRDRRAGRQAVALGGTCRPAPRRIGDAETGARRRRSHRRGDRRPSDRRDVRGPDRARRRHPRRREAAVLRRDGPAATGRASSPRARRRAVARVVLRLPRQAERTRARGLRGPPAGDGRGRRRRRPRRGRRARRRSTAGGHAGIVDAGTADRRAHRPDAWPLPSQP